MGDRSLGTRSAHALGRAEHLGIEVKCLGAAVDDQGWGDPAVAVRDRLGLGQGHMILLLVELSFLAEAFALQLIRRPADRPIRHRAHVLVSDAALTCTL